MPVDIRLHPEAERELRAAFLWYYERNLLAAQSFQAEAAHAIDAVAVNPKRWAKLTESTRTYVFPRFPFSLVYRIRRDIVEVIAIAHHKRRPAYWRLR